MASKLHLFFKKYSAQLYAGWVLFIALITLLPGYSIPGNIDWNFLELDKIIHMVIFGVLTYLGCYFYLSRTKQVKTAIVQSVLPAIVYGLVIEFLQMFIPQRGFDYADFTADVLGALIGVLLFRFIVLKNYPQS